MASSCKYLHTRHKCLRSREQWRLAVSGPGRRDRSAAYRSHGSAMKGCREIAREGQSPGTEVSFTYAMALSFCGEQFWGGLFGRRRLARVPTLFEFPGAFRREMWRRTPSSTFSNRIEDTLHIWKHQVDGNPDLNRGADDVPGRREVKQADQPDEEPKYCEGHRHDPRPVL